MLVVVGLLVSGCAGGGGGAAAGGAGGGVYVVAAENFWGSIASQLGGTRASVHSIIVDPAQDPHSYEPTAADARTLATAQLAIVNGIGYDPWSQRLLAANPTPGRVVLNVGDLFGLKEGDNPHRWYDPAEVEAVANAITNDLRRLDPQHGAYYEHQRASFENRGLAQYHALIARIRARYAGVPVGASESIFAPLAPALGLRLITPSSFMTAISEGTEVTAQDTSTTRLQINSHQLKVWIYNTQNATPDVQRLTDLATAARIPVATLTETLSPASASFEQWQVTELSGIARALHEATGR